MSQAIQLSIITGPHQQDHYCFRDKTRCTIGRSSDNKVQLDGFEKDTKISRHHCELDINPPKVSVRDLGSSNGTFINGKHFDKIQRQRREDGFLELEHSDVLTIGGTTLQIHVLECTFRLKLENPSLLPLTPPEPKDGEACEKCQDKCLEATEAVILSDGVTVLWRT